MYEIFEQLLQKYGITTYKVSKETGIPQSTFSTWKSKRNLLSPDKAKVLADYFGVSLDFFMTGIEDNEIPENSLAKRTEKDLMKLFGITKEQYLSQEEFIIDGEKVSRKDIEFIFDTMESLLENVKKRSKDL